MAEDRLCPACMRPVSSDELRYTDREPKETWHAHCWSVTRPEPTNTRDLFDQMYNTLVRAQDALEKLRKELK